MKNAAFRLTNVSAQGRNTAGLFGRATFTRIKEGSVQLCPECGHELFGSRAHYDSRVSWQGIWQAIDRPHGQILCGGCGGDVGYLFEYYGTTTK